MAAVGLPCLGLLIDLHREGSLLQPERCGLQCKRWKHGVSCRHMAAPIPPC
jgi:hypothetical protein